MPVVSVAPAYEGCLVAAFSGVPAGDVETLLADVEIAIGLAKKYSHDNKTGYQVLG